MSLKITVEAARDYWGHVSQHVDGVHPDLLPEEGFHYYACGDLCLVFHLMHAPSIYMVHCGARPDGWGNLIDPARKILEEAWNDLKAQRIVCWTNRPQATAFARRVGFTEDGKMPLAKGIMTMQGWAK